MIKFAVTFRSIEIDTEKTHIRIKTRTKNLNQNVQEEETSPNRKRVIKEKEVWKARVEKIVFFKI